MRHSISEGIFCAEHESGLENVPSHHVFEKSPTLKNSVVGHFQKILQKALQGSVIGTEIGALEK